MSLKSELAPLPLRFMFGFAFIYHGLPKISSLAGHQAFAGSLKKMQVPIPDIMAWIIGGIEVFGGLALIVGAFVVVSSLLLIIDMLVAMLKVHLSNGFAYIHVIGSTDKGPILGMPGIEVNLLYIAGLLTLMFTGAGIFSIDERGTKRYRGKIQ